MTEQLIDSLTRALGPGRVCADVPDTHLTDGLGHDRGHAIALVQATSTEDVSRTLAWASAHGVSVTPRGGGTNVVGSTIPGGGVVLDLTALDRILDVDADNFEVTVEAGVRLADLQAYLAPLALFYPPDPGEKQATIGGNIATNAGGMRAVKYGVTRDYVRRLTVVLADGTVIRTGGKTAKDATGLALRHLFTGSEGTLGVITEATLRVLPATESSRSVLLAFSDLATGIGGVLDIIRADLGPTAVEFMDRKAVALGEEYDGYVYPYPEAGSYILLTFDGHEDAVEAALTRLDRVARAAGALGIVVLSDPSDCAAVWRLRGNLVKAVEAISQQEPVDIVVPIATSARYVAFIEELSERSGLRMVAFGHAGDGNIHLCVLRDGRAREEWLRVLHSTMDEAYARAAALGGLPSGEHGIGRGKQRYFFASTPPENVRVMRAIKAALDPSDILNPGVSYAAPTTR